LIALCLSSGIDSAVTEVVSASAAVATRICREPACRWSRHGRFPVVGQEVQVTGRSGDEGIDGIGLLQVNPLVSFKVLFQCKRYRKSVTPSHVRDFRGAMGGRADKGIIIMTGTFTSDARKEAVRDGVPAIELVDGQKLVGMLENLELGLTPVKAFRITRAFFEDFKEPS